MKLIHVAASVLNQTPLDWQHNSANVRQAIQVARDRGAVVVCLPELCLTGYGCEDAFQRPIHINERGMRSMNSCPALGE